MVFFSKALPLLSVLLTGASASPLLRVRDNMTPAFEADFPDPAIFKTSDGTFYAYATAGNGVNAQVATSTDQGLSWSRLEGTDAFGDAPAWTSGSNLALWAPDVTFGDVRSCFPSLLALRDTDNDLVTGQLRDVLLCHQC
jgi:hypothetical protein